MTDSPAVFQGRIKIFTDGADKCSILAAASNPHVAGLTTNPSLLKQAGVSDYAGFCREIVGSIPEDKPISLEVLADSLDEMERQAREIATWGKNVFVKIPIVNSVGECTGSLIHKLAHDQISLNVTAILTPEKVRVAAQALRGGAPSIVSVFAGRIADTGCDPIPHMVSSLEICRECDSNIELLWASTREAFNIVQAEQIGCNIITVRESILKQLERFGMSLDQVMLETVQKFKADADAAEFDL